MEERHKKYKEESCWSSWVCSIMLIWPIGAIAGLVLSIVSLTMIISGLTELTDEMKKIDVDMGVILPMADNLVLAVVWTDLLVTFYGLREKIRTRFAILRHIDNCLACCGKFVIKGVVNGSCAISVALACIMTVLLEGLYIVLVCADNACRTTQSSVTDILEAIPGYKGSKDPLDEVCEIIEGARSGAFNVWFGSMGLVIGQFVVSLYWMKYSTLGLAGPFYQDVQVVHRKKFPKKVHPEEPGAMQEAVAIDLENPEEKSEDKFDEKVAEDAALRNNSLPPQQQEQQEQQQQQQDSNSTSPPPPQDDNPSLPSATEGSSAAAAAAVPSSAPPPLLQPDTGEEGKAADAGSAPSPPPAAAPVVVQVEVDPEAEDV